MSLLMLPGNGFWSPENRTPRTASGSGPSSLQRLQAALRPRKTGGKPRVFVKPREISVSVGPFAPVVPMWPQPLSALWSRPADPLQKPISHYTWRIVVARGRGVLPPAANASTPRGATERNISMSDFDRNYAAVRRFGADRAVAIDAGLRAHMIRVYNYMAAGVALTGLAAWLTFQFAVSTTSTGTLALTPFGQAIYGTPLTWIFILAPLGLVFFLSFRITSLSASTARALFFVYAASLGLSLSVIFLVYTMPRSPGYSSSRRRRSGP